MSRVVVYVNSQVLYLFWLALILLGSASMTLGQSIKAPALYEQCQSLTVRGANSIALTNAMDALKNAEVKKRRDAALSLSKTCDPRAITPLLVVLREPDIEMRIAAVEALGKLGDATAIDPMIEAIQGGEWRLRAALALALGSFNVHRARNATLNLLVNTGGESVREYDDMYARCLGVLVINQMRDVRFSRKAVGFLFDFLSHKDPKLRNLAEAAATELQHTRNGYHEMIGILQQHGYPPFRRLAAYWLGIWGLPAARVALAEAASNDKDPSVQIAARESLTKIK